ncbi:MAG: hypothetical protein KBB79_00835, partial [Candidatus Omnitrophica bacterium]|nr:hypothetical protein [Candidatus Omnitrophota bacterium]
MRRHRPNTAVIIAGSLILAALLFLDLHGRVFFSDFKTSALEMIRDKIGLEGEIGGLEGGVSRGIVLKDVKVYLPASEEPGSRRELFFCAEAIELA